MKRRELLKSGIMLSLYTFVLSGFGFYSSKISANWPKHLFHTDTIDRAIKGITGQPFHKLQTSDRVKLKVDKIVEDGSTVPVTITSELKATKTITVLSDKNPNPVIARYQMTSNIAPTISTRIKMGGSGSIIAVVETDNGYFSASKKIKVTSGGCT
ncbi:hypothetical protein A3193_10225 [Candidatus Thiodiazotropha endoloripes]|uniref:thiosulfate oxidation carrier protein SoxY n=1 Tax=Candidatus Thiodiazotropha endoloripes TaxID=1818881 RepID=UPI00083D3143|nr:thiosulfate oxidation carrier protein SoxY [Candidatus Thiodiazotropha endoloripes]ODB89148.1 hypothetical protein A3193_10225 [Candidatus Thiodiazotropha endoloripes]